MKNTYINSTKREIMYAYERHNWLFGMDFEEKKGDNGRETRALASTTKSGRINANCQRLETWTKHQLAFLLHLNISHQFPLQCRSLSLAKILLMLLQRRDYLSYADIKNEWKSNSLAFVRTIRIKKASNMKMPRHCCASVTSNLY